jgi:hypothetical protein
LPRLVPLLRISKRADIKTQLFQPLHQLQRELRELNDPLTLEA